jgi:glycosidase
MPAPVDIHSSRETAMRRTSRASSILIVPLVTLAVLALLSTMACQRRVPVQVPEGVQPEEALPEAPFAPVTHPEWSHNASIYEVNVRQFSAGGTFREFEAHLPRLKALGVKIIWLMPIHPIGVQKRKGSLGSYYSVKDYLAVNPEFGTMDDFRSLVDRIHDMGMYVIIDWVANHSAWDNPLTKEHPGWFTRDVQGNLVPPNPDWSDVVDFNYNNRELWGYMIGAMEFWVRDVGIDGFRCDVAGMVPLEFWNAVRARLDAIKPVFILAEWEDPAAHEHAFDMTYGWDLYHLMNKLAKRLVPASAIGIYLDREVSRYPKDAYRMYFTSNHDENSWNGTVFERLGEAAEVMAVLACTLDGMPLVYSGQEAGLNRRLEFFEKDEIPWREHQFRDLYSTLLNLKQQSRALWNGDQGGDVTWIHTSNDGAVFAFVREKDADKVLVVLNLSAEQQAVELGGTAFLGSYTDVFTVGEKHEIRFTGGETVDLKPWGYRVYAGSTVDPPTDTGKIQSDLDQLLEFMTGSFSSRAQAEADTNYLDIRLEMVQVWKNRTDGYWLYVEQAVATHKDRPYRQRIYHLSDQADASIRSEVYSIPDPLRFAGAYNEPRLLIALTPDSLQVRRGCAVILRRRGPDVFAGSTVDRDCVSELRGATYATSEVRITPQELTSWDRGYDLEDRQVWGAVEGGYVFRKTE